ncbi:hypothetical protein BTO20_07665 [Mycobacterium dioxanotrophicus]|uniref:Uncharacterized protein n=1 Tax=Mycobacterium dioxanotrophicus TaxID=482462 RepID=A0A1Y0BZZ8_9MYCO|nr:hypothetical protein [Mycobacterium dioxanotrophicus]ART68472.1 hypothetical protein BTO20_07665 [Mycobacterium dioxanotrophicus]
MAAANQATGGEAAKEIIPAISDPASAVVRTGKQLSTSITKTQKSLTHAQERVTKVTDKLKTGDVGGAVKQVGENVKNRVERVNKDVNNGLNKLKGKDSSS